MIELENYFGELNFVISTLKGIVEGMYNSSIVESFIDPEAAIKDIQELNGLREQKPFSSNVDQIEGLYIEISSNCKDIIKAKHGKHHGIFVQLSDIDRLLKKIRKYS